MITLKRSDFPSDEAFLSEIKKHGGKSAQAHLNPDWTVQIAGFAFSVCCGVLRFAKFKADPKTLVVFDQDHRLGVRALVSYFHTIEIDE
ncbi:MAG: hypothetical protein WC657_03130 [Candidatus Paceibacterota bacterium]|jgi:hypothetical protein